MERRRHHQQRGTRAHHAEHEGSEPDYGAYVGIVRSNVRLTRAWNRLDILYEETERLFKRSKAPASCANCAT